MTDVVRIPVKGGILDGSELSLDESPGLYYVVPYRKRTYLNGVMRDFQDTYMRTIDSWVLESTEDVTERMHAARESLREMSMRRALGLDDYDDYDEN